MRGREAGHPAAEDGDGSPAGPAAPLRGSLEEPAAGPARAAVNALLEAAGSRQAPAALFTLYRPPEYEAAKQEDRRRYAAGQPNHFDIA